MVLGLIAGKGLYPQEVLRGARQAGCRRVVVAAFSGETAEDWPAQADAVSWLRVGQLSRMMNFFRAEGVTDVLMAGQISPKRLFDFRPDWRTLWLLARLPVRNAETLFGAVAEEIQAAGMNVLEATRFVDHWLATAGWIAGPPLHRRARADVALGFRIAKEVSRLDIGQTVVVRNGTVLAVEGFEGTNEVLRRGGALGQGKALAVKVSKPGQDMRFDVPVIGPDTLKVAAESGINTLVCEPKKTLLLQLDLLKSLAHQLRITLWGYEEGS